MKGSELMQTSASDTKNVAPAMRPVSITLKAGEWELLFKNATSNRNQAGDDRRNTRRQSTQK